MFELKQSILSAYGAIECWNFNEVYLLLTTLLNARTLKKYSYFLRGYWMLELQWNILASHKVIDYWILNDVSLSRKWQYECFKFNEVSLLTTTLLIVGSSMRYPCCLSGNMNAGILMKHPYRHKDINCWILNDVSFPLKLYFECWKFIEVSLLPTRIFIVGSLRRYLCLPSSNMNVGT